MRTWLARRMVVVLAVVTMLALGGSVVLAAIPSGGGMIYACYGKTTGALRVVNYPAVRCASSERLLSWTQIGPKAPPLASIGIKTVDLDQRFVETRTDQWGVLSAWMETGSASKACLATLGGTAWDSFDVVVFCQPRRVTVNGVDRWGIWLHVFTGTQFPATAPSAAPYYTVNVYQEGAKQYGDPRFYPCPQTGCPEP
jgi:hypothetical protein